MHVALGPGLSGSIKIRASATSALAGGAMRIRFAYGRSSQGSGPSRQMS